MSRPLRYVQINEYSEGWAESIVFGKHRELLENGVDSYVFWGRGRTPQNKKEMRIAHFPEVCVDALLTRIDDRAGFHSRSATRRLLRRLDEIEPDIVHLHVLHGYYLNVEMLFQWLADHQCKVLWTLHDCWPFTGHCQYFTRVGCKQWEHCCAAEAPCPQTHTYPKSICKSNVSRNYVDKRRIFTSIPPERMTLISPSKWLADLVRRSYFADYPIEVRHNKVDRDVFCPTASNFRERYGIGNRFMVLGVASSWTARKGLDDFIELARRLDDNRFAIVLIGLQKKQIRQLSHERLTALPKSGSARELAAAYTAADVLVQPSIEETFGMTVAEAQACGSHVIVSRGSACAEIADPSHTSAVEPDISSIQAEVVRLEGGGYLMLAEPVNDRRILAAIYSAADILFNPTHDDNFPTVNLEAQACGTPVVTYSSGGSAETLWLESSTAVRNLTDCIDWIENRRLNWHIDA